MVFDSLRGVFDAILVSDNLRSQIIDRAFSLFLANEESKEKKKREGLHLDQASAILDGSS